MSHQIPGFVFYSLVLSMQGISQRWLSGSRAKNYSLLTAINIGAACLVVASFLMSFDVLSRLLPTWCATWIEASGLMISAGVWGLFGGALLYRRAPYFELSRRTALKAAAGAVVAAPAVITTLGIVQRNRLQFHEVDVPMHGLHPDLHGLRIVQVTDVHLSAFLSEAELARAIDMANEAKAHLAVMTGDLITRTGDPVDACLRQLRRLRADAGVIGCLGNHEHFTELEDYVTTQGRRMGIDFLRSQNRVMRFGTADINFAGVDYQRFRSPYLTGGSALVRPGMTNILLSHNPDVFPVAARQGYGLTVAGHTHGGQVNFEILSKNVNVARYFTPFVRGLYTREGSSVYVSTGIGTVGVPVRMGAAAEIAVLRLCAT